MAIVDRVTKTLVFVDGSKYRRDTGELSPSSCDYFNPSLVEPTTARLAQIKKDRLVSAMRNFTKWDTLPTDKLVLIEAIMRAKP